MNTANHSSLSKVNKSVFTISTVIIIALVGGYFIEVIKGQKTLAFFAVFAALAVLPLLINFIILKRNPASPVFRVSSLVSMLLLYSFALLYSEAVFQYAMILPILLQYFLYFDIKLCAAASLAVCAINFVKLFIMVAVLKIVDGGMTTQYTVQILAVIIFSWALIWATQLSNRFNKEKLDSIEEKNRIQSEVLQSIISIATTVDASVRQTSELTEDLAASAKALTQSMEEIAGVSQQNAESIQEQSVMTQNIHTLINEAANLSADTGKISNETARIVGRGLQIAESLQAKSNTSRENGEQVYAIINLLQQKCEEISAITNIITGISDQTNLLALNASIESARAGEAGRGFAVVSEEVRKLAEQSQQSAVDISGIIRQLIENTEKTVQSVQALVDANIEKDALVRDVFALFGTIGDSMKQVEGNTQEVMAKVTEILSSNSIVVEKVNELSAASQESMAISVEAAQMAQATLAKVDGVAETATTVKNEFKQLERYMTQT